MKKITVTYKDTDVSPTETRKYEEEIEDVKEAVAVLEVIAEKLCDNEPRELSGNEAYDRQLEQGVRSDV